MKITTVLAAFAASSLFATGAFAQTMQPIPNPPEAEHPAHHMTHHHATHHAHHAHHAKSGAPMGGEQKGTAAPKAPRG
jgi:hypothetical protein